MPITDPRIARVRSLIERYQDRMDPAVNEMLERFAAAIEPLRERSFHLVLPSYRLYVELGERSSDITAEDRAEIFTELRRRMPDLIAEIVEDVCTDRSYTPFPVFGVHVVHVAETTETDAEFEEDPF